MTTPAHERARQDRAGEGPKPWRLYEVTVDWFGRRTYTATVAAPSRAAARYRQYLDASDAYPDLTFGQFQGMCRARLAAGQPDPDAYAHIRRFYGLDFAHGDRVSIRNEGAEDEGRLGTVVHPQGSTHYVHVVLDGNADRSLLHPNSVVKLTPTCDTPAFTAGEDGGRL